MSETICMSHHNRDAVILFAQQLLLRNYNVWQKQLTAHSLTANRGKRTWAY